MKKIIILLMIIPLFSFSQVPMTVENGSIFFESVYKVDSTSRDVLFNRALDWVGKTFSSPDDVISYQNIETGTIQASYSMDYQLVSLSKLPFQANLEILFKEGRYKVRISNFKNQQGYSIESYLLKKDGTYRGQYDKFREDVITKTNILFEDLYSSVCKNTDDSDW